MEENKSQQQLIKIIVWFAGLIFAALLVVGIIQTFVHNSLVAKQRELEARNQNILQSTEQVNEEIAVREGDDYIDELFEQENGYGNEGDVIIKPQN